MAEYMCKLCGYKYNEKEGEARRNIKPGTLWEDVPDDFICPNCGASKSMHVKV